MKLSGLLTMMAKIKNDMSSFKDYKLAFSSLTYLISFRWKKCLQIPHLLHPGET